MNDSKAGREQRLFRKTLFLLISIITVVLLVSGCTKDGNPGTDRSQDKVCVKWEEIKTVECINETKLHTFAGFGIVKLSLVNASSLKTLIPAYDLRPYEGGEAGISSYDVVQSATIDCSREVKIINSGHYACVDQDAMRRNRCVLYKFFLDRCNTLEINNSCDNGGNVGTITLSNVYNHTDAYNMTCVYTVNLPIIATSIKCTAYLNTTRKGDCLEYGA